MRNRKLSSTGDYTFGHSEQDFWRDVPDAVAQAIETRLYLMRGEWFLDLQEGTPLLDGILGKHPPTLIDNTIQQRALKTQGLTGLSKYESEIDPDTRAISASFLIDTIYGPTPVQIQNYANY
jgi:hypothetical protein